MKKQTESTLTVLLVEPEKKPRVVTIPHTLKEMQNLVGGLIECTQPFTDSEVALISNEEGKLLGLPLNRASSGRTAPSPTTSSQAHFSLSAPPPTQRNLKACRKTRLKHMRRDSLTPSVFSKPSESCILFRWSNSSGLKHCRHTLRDFARVAFLPCARARCFITKKAATANPAADIFCTLFPTDICVLYYRKMTCYIF